MPTNSDNADRLRFTEQLRKAEARFRIVCDSMPVGLMMLSLDGTIQFINSKTEKLFKLEAEQMVGRNLASLLYYGQEHSFSELLEEVQQKGGHTETEALRGSGHVFPIELSLREFEAADQPSWLATVMDITDRREIERLKQDLIAMVSHDLSTPLTSIQTTLNLLSLDAGGALNEKGKAMVTRAERSAGQLIKLINDLLTVERLEGGKIDLFPQPVDVDDLLFDSLQLVIDEAQKANVAINQKQAALEIVADGDRLKQVVVNFLSNAIKFSPPGSTIEISAVSNDDKVTISVLDQGRGVPKNAQKRIFERFQQVQSSDASEKGGRGLGLAICKAIVEQHGGTIGVTSEDGQGSSFWFCIPRQANKD